MKKSKYSLIFILVLSISILVKPYKAIGDVGAIDEANKQLQGISKEEQQILEELFFLSQEMEEMEREEARTNNEINELIAKIDQLDGSIHKEKDNYDNYLAILEQLLVSYQRGGPASYLDILLSAKNLTSFIKSLNLIKDVSKNTGELLTSIEDSKLKLEEEKLTLASSMLLLEDKREDLLEAIANKKKLVKQQEDYLESLAEEKEVYQQHLDNLNLMWKNIKDLFLEIVDEFARIVSEGHFTMEDLNLQFGFFTLKGSIHEDAFNRIMNDNSRLSSIIFSFEKDSIRVEVPEYNLVLNGYFILEGASTLMFVPESGTFYEMSLEKESIEELFRNGPLIVDFEQAVDDMVTIELKLKEVYTADGFIYFSVDLGSLF